MSVFSSPALPFVLPGARTLPADGVSHRPDVLRAICFSVDGYQFALPVTAISKVAHCPSFDGTDLGKAGLIHLDRQVIQILDLHSLLVGSPKDITRSGQFLVVARCQDRPPAGIPADAPPDLIEIPRSTIRPLPPQGERSPLTHLARFVAMLPASGVETSIFLLDLARAQSAAELAS